MKKPKKTSVNYTFTLSGGGFILIMTLLPVFWEGCPWTWYVGLAISFGAMLILDIIAFVFLKVQFDALAAVCENTVAEIQGQSGVVQREPVEYQNMSIDPELSYLIALDGTDIIVMHKDDKCYGLLAAYDEDMKAALAAIDGADKAEPVRQHISSTVNWVETSDDIDGLCFVCSDGYQLFNKDELAALHVRDFIDVKLGEKPYDERVLHVLLNSEDGEEWNYTTASNNLATFLDEYDASLCADANGFEHFKVEKLRPEEIIQILQQCDGLVVMNYDGLVLYKNNAERVTKILQKM